MRGLLANIPWKRFWIPRETAPVLDGHGYLADPEGQYGKLFNPHARTLEDLDDVPCVALLGEPGIGKSHVVDAYRAAVFAREPDGLMLPIDCRWHHDLKAEIFATEPFKLWLSRESPLTLIIDSLDEHPEGPAWVARQLVGQISRGPVSLLRLRVACRTAEWPATLEGELPRLWDVHGEAPRAVVYVLAPLRQRDVELAAEHKAVEFLAQVEQREAQPLAMRPITLKFLLEEFHTHGALPRTREELYRSGCLRLCEEMSRTREDADRPGELDPEARLAIAARIAAVCILGHRSLLHRGALRGSMPSEAVRVRDLVGGTEPSSVGDVEVTVEAIDDVMKVSGLFTARGEAYVGWAHQPYAEFLTAWFLRSRGLSPDEVLRELSNQTMGKIVPALRETGAWLASTQKEFFDLLLATDSEPLLGSDFAMAGNTEREALTREVLRAIDRRELSAHSVLHRRDVSSRLEHSGLAEQLAPYISEREHYVRARCVAIDIANECKVESLQDLLADVALDPTEVDEVREACVRAVCHLGSRATKRRLKPLIRGGVGPDPEDSLKGYALQALWLDDLGSSELFDCLGPPQDETHGGSYGSFLHELGASLTPEVLPEALRWTTKLPARHQDQLSYAFSSLLDDILSAGWWHIHDARVRSALAEAVRQRLALHDHIFEHQSYRGDQKPDPEHDDVRRHLLAGALMTLAPLSERESFYYARNRLILVQDIPWVIERVKSDPVPVQRARWARILSDVASRNWTFEVADPVIATLSDVEELQQALPWLFPLQVELGSPESRWMRRAIRQERKAHGKWRYKPTHKRREKKRRPSVKRFIRHAIRSFRAGELEYGWRIQHALLFAPRGTPVDHDKGDLTKSPGWQQADEAVWAQIVDIGRGYLLRAEERAEEWLGKNVWFYPARAGYRYVRLIEQLDPQWLEQNEKDVWARWSAIALAFEPNANESSRRIVARAYRSQPARVLEALRVLLVEDNRRHDYPFPIFHMASCWDGMLGRFVLDFVREHEDLKPRFFGELLDEMIVHDVDGAVAYATSILAGPVPASGLKRLRMHAAAHALMAFAPEVGWPIVRNLAEADEPFVREVFLTFPNELERGRSRTWGKRLSTGDGTDLYLWLERNFPPDGDPQDRGHGFHAVTPRHMVGELRNRLLGELASRGTHEAIATIKCIQQEFPGRDFTPYLHSAREAAAQATWIPRTPRDLIALRPALAADPEPLARDALLDALGSLLPAEFENLLATLGAPVQYLPGREAPQAARAVDLLRWAENNGRLPEVERLYRRLTPSRSADAARPRAGRRAG